MRTSRGATEKMAGFVKALAGRTRRLGDCRSRYSNGANILANVLIEEGLFDKAVLMHPLIPFVGGQSALAGRKILITAGERDPIAQPR